MAVRYARIDGRRRLLVERTVEASVDTVWDLLIDTERWPEWGPSVRAVEAADRRIRRGTTGRVRTPVGVWVPFEITRFEEYRWGWTVARIPATGHRVDPLGADSCRVAFELPVIAAGYAPVCERALGRIDRLATSRDF